MARTERRKGRNINRVETVNLARAARIVEEADGVIHRAIRDRRTRTIVTIIVGSINVGGGNVSRIIGRSEGTDRNVSMSNRPTLVRNRIVSSFIAMGDVIVG